MKIKTDFVTNSSSTSFIVVFPKLVESIDDVLEYIPQKYATTVYNDAICQTPVSLKSVSIDNVIEEMSHGYFKGINDYETIKKLEIEFCKRNLISEKDLFKNMVWRKQFMTEEATFIKNKLAKKAKNFLEKAGEEGYVYIFNYSDSTDYGSELEHNHIFENLRVIEINQH